MKRAGLRKFTDNIEFSFPPKKNVVGVVKDKGYKEKLLRNSKIGSNIGIALRSLSGMGLGSILGNKLAGNKEKQVSKYLKNNPDKTKEVAELIFNKKKDKYKSIGRVSVAILGSIGGYLAGDSIGKRLTKENN